jgi:large subunit ribosomal protein L32
VLHPDFSVLFATFFIINEETPMAVQQARTTRSRRGMRRAHDALSPPTLSADPQTGELHRRHHISPKGFYRGRKVLLTKQDKQDQASDE